MLAPDKEALLILAKALDLSWATTMALLFLGAPDYRIAAKDLDAMKAEFARLDVETSKKVLKAYHSRKESGGSNLRRLPQLHALCDSAGRRHGVLFLGARDYRIAAKDLDVLKAEFAWLDVEASKKVLKAYHSRKESGSSSLRRLPQLHAL